jgi:hypothetical protein
MTKAQTLDLQRDLHRLGYYGGPIDGIYGPLTERAYKDYWATRPVEITVPILAPEPAKPWYASTALLGALVTIAGAAAGLAGWEFDVESAKDLLPAVITLLGGIAAWVGTIKRKAPIDPTLVARVGTHDLRLPSRLRSDPVPTGSSAEHKDPRGLFGE